MNGQLKLGERVELIGGEAAGFGGALATTETAAQGQSCFIVAEFGQQGFNFRGKLTGLADALERGVGGDFTSLNAEELPALELATAHGTLRIHGAGASVVVERRTGLVHAGASGEERGFVARLRSDVSEEDAVAAQAALQAELVGEIGCHWRMMPTGQWSLPMIWGRMKAFLRRGRSAALTRK